MKFLKKADFPSVFLIGSLCIFGLFHEFLACAAGVALAVYILIYVLRNKKLTFYVNLTSIAVAVITAGYLFSVFYAVDKGSAVVGFFKFLPVLLFLIVLMQQSSEEDFYLKTLPPVACMMTIVSSVLMQIPALTQWFAVSGRVAGFFQYSNTFALFLLIAFVVVATKEKLTIPDYIYAAVFMFGILYSGSRTVFVLSVVALVAIIVFGKNKKTKIAFGVTALVAVVGAVLYTVITKDFDSIGRFLTMSVSESTFVGRFLYFIDAAPVILKHPFGTGYLGYYFMQQSFQTGVYAVKFVHNEFLQLMLDIGWVPAVLFAAAVIRSFLKKGGSLRKRILIFVMTAHCCFDFDLQFVAIFMIFVMLLDYKDGKEKQFRMASIPVAIVATVLSALCLYIGTAQALVYFKQYDHAAKLYPWDTVAQVKVLEKTGQDADAQELADWILEHNEYVAAAYNKKSQIVYAKGDFAKVIEYKNEALRVAPFSYQTQEEYCYMLINGIYLYNNINDDYSARICQQELLRTVESVRSAKSRLSKLGTMIEDQPVTTLPEDILQYAMQLSRAESEK